MAEYECSIFLRGDVASGKTSLLYRFACDFCDGACEITIDDSITHVFDVDGVRVKCNFLDLEGHDLGPSHDIYMHQADGFVMVYRSAFRRSFDEISWMHDSALQRLEVDSFPMVLVATGCDESRQEVPPSEGQKLADSWGCPFFVASAQTGQNVKEVFHEAVRQIWRRSKGFVNINDNTEEKKKGNCALM